MTGVVAACAALAICGLALVLVRRSRRDAEQRLAAVLDRIGTHLDAISASVEASISRVVEAQNDRLQPLTLDFDALVEEIVSEAAARTGADAVVLRLEGPGGRPVIAATGTDARGDLVERTFAPLEARTFRAATIDWTYSASGDVADEQFHSALVAPLAEAAGFPGTLVAYARASHAFRPDHAAILHDLLAEVSTGLANARRFADVEARLLLDPETGVANRRGYEVELGREVARASRTGRPLSVVFVGISSSPDTATTGTPRGVEGFAKLLTRVTRRSDISCRRGDGEFAILLPETRSAGASVLTNRLREEVRRALAGGHTSVTVGHVEWQPDESVEALEARVEAELTSPKGARASVRAAPIAVSRTAPSAEGSTAHHEPDEALRQDALEAVAREILDARPHGRSLAVVALEVDGLEQLSEVDRESADAVLGTIAARLSDSVGGGTVHRVGVSEFVLVLSGATADDAEALLGSLHDSAEADELAGITLTAGVTEIVDRDGAQTVLGRAEHALWQAAQAGPGSVVVAVPGRRRRS
ncbi:MAG TPA: diguanylate cyclase [Gaiellaceae bacterium]|nr:diguanylate cyclase [Gaiellaceae bacterium]